MRPEGVRVSTGKGVGRAGFRLDDADLGHGVPHSVRSPVSSHHEPLALWWTLLPALPSRGLSSRSWSAPGESVPVIKSRRGRRPRHPDDYSCSYVRRGSLRSSTPVQQRLPTLRGRRVNARICPKAVRALQPQPGRAQHRHEIQPNVIAGQPVEGGGLSYSMQPRDAVEDVRSPSANVPHPDRRCSREPGWTLVPRDQPRDV